MRSRGALSGVGLGLGSLAWVACAAASSVLKADPEIAEARVAAGSYYVGRVFGPRDYRGLANATMSGYLVMKGELTQRQFTSIVAWAVRHGYGFEPACVGCDRSHPGLPAAGVSWRDAALLANALSEMRGLDPVYRDKAGAPVRSAVPPDAIDHTVIEPSLSGFRLPTIPEWQIAMRGADKAMAAGRYGEEPGATNALGLSGTGGPLAEWTASGTDLGQGKQFYLCNEPVDGRNGLTNCGLHAPGFAESVTAIRYVRRP